MPPATPLREIHIDDPARPDSTAHRRGRTLSLWCAVPLALLVAAAAVSAAWVGDAILVQIGFTAPGTVALVAAGIARSVAVISGSVTLGALVFAALIAPTAAADRIGVDGFRAYETARRWSTLWLPATLVSAVLTALTTIGLGLRSLANASIVLIAFETAEQAKGWLVAAVAVAIATVALRRIVGWTSGLAVAGVVVIALIAPMVTGNPGQGSGHDLATSAVVVHAVAAACWIGVLWSVAVHLRSRPVDDRSLTPLVARRISTACGVSAIAVVVSGLVLGGVLSELSAFWTRYGVLVLVKLGLGVGVLVPLVIWTRRTLTAGPSARWWLPLLLQSGCLAVAFGTSAGLAGQPAPTALTGGNLTNSLLIGYELPEPLGVGTLLSTWRFDLVLGSAAVLGAVLYVRAVIRARRRGLRWPVSRLVSWLLGCLLVVLSTSSGVASYAGAMFSVHMVVHMTLNMFAPILLILGGPLTLVLRSVVPAPRGTSGPREWLVWLMHSRLFRALANPAVAIPVYVVSLYGLYFTTLLDPLLRYHWGHLLMNTHFLLTGYLFYWSIIGVDPGPKRFPYLGRVASLFAVMPFHAFFGVIVMNEKSLLAPDFYGSLTLPWMQDQLGDQVAGGAIAWIAGEIPLLVVVLALCSQWYRADTRKAQRTDRHEDEDFDAYNRMLQKLAEMRS